MNDSLGGPAFGVERCLPWSSVAAAEGAAAKARLAEAMGECKAHVAQLLAGSGVATGAEPDQVSASCPVGHYPGQRPRRVALRPVRLVVQVVTTFVATAVGFVVIGVLTGAWGLGPVLTGSMRPGIQPGDVVLVTPEPVSAVAPGQVLVFKPPGLGGATVVHRVVSVRTVAGRAVIRTKGDANDVPDPWRARLGGTKAWRVRAVIPKVGYLAVAEQHPIVRSVLEFILIAGGLAIALSVVWRRQPEDHSDELASVGAAFG